MTEAELLARVAELVQRVTEARFEGARFDALARARGYADGYARALLDAGLVDREGVLRVTAEGHRAAVDAADSAAA